MHKSTTTHCLSIALLLLFCGGAVAATGQALSRVAELEQAALLVEASGRSVIAQRADRPLIPASTMKLLTALAAIERWGLDHRFRTDIYLTDDNWLWVKGLGDPFLVSEELDRIVSELRRAGRHAFAGIGIDGDLYAQQLRIPGRAGSDNPYDAPVTAVGVNFNTVHVRVGATGVTSAERQTPLTPLARELAAGLGTGSHRINLRGRDLALRYAGEVFAAKLGGGQVGLRIGPVPVRAKRLLSYSNSRTLRPVLAAMLEYSNNFVANQLFLLLAADEANRPVDLVDAQRALTDWAERRFGWAGFRIEDGAGLSRGNRLTARQLMDVLNAFAPYRDLLPVQPGNSAVRAKTGTLTGVSCYAGYVRRGGGWMTFALLVNQSVDPSLRRQVADELAWLDALEPTLLQRSMLR